ncbi:hypothetical protein MCHI_003528 [Candidatus Magnetoovum chiemensis]|nr:hypothetical protein MCHI_003528 [Candidatus Magnetoovum chiemensis]
MDIDKIVLLLRCIVQPRQSDLSYTEAAKRFHSYAWLQTAV